MEVLEHHERAEKTAHGGQHPPAHANPFNKRVAVLITLLAAALAICEMGGKSTQNDYMAKHIEASNLWAFFQAKTIRATTVRGLADTLDVLPPAQADAARKVATALRAAAARYDDEPETGEGRKQLAEKAKAAEKQRDMALKAYHFFEYGAAAFQIAIVLASAAVIVGLAWLAFLAGGLGLAGMALAGAGWIVPVLGA